MHVVVSKDEDVLLFLQLKDTADLLLICLHVDFVFGVAEELSVGLKIYGH